MRPTGQTALWRKPYTPESLRAFLVAKDLRRRAGIRRRSPAASESGRRVSYGVAVPITRGQRAQLQAKATAEVWLVSSYVGKLIVEDLARG